MKTGKNLKSSIVSGLSLLANSVGVSIDKIVRETGVSLTSLLDNDARVSELGLHRLLTLIDKALPGKAGILELAKRIPPSLFGKEVALIFQASTLEQAMLLWANYYDLLSDSIEVELIDSKNHLAVRIHHPLDETDQGIGGDLALAVKYRFICDYFGAQAV
ncbi:AraC family transcriptional regulator ligand-binding domain-containing protein [Thalassomonas viridans]|uniref:AraC family transcriptional regulator ligand-binding domain-containing protein n=1 Tax=Thalassomonas viridans TaxID=137584 RepID=UPI0022A8E261|nr:AraC family transcriptional regulator ligand-binding domain-containing protein [Thalassomonas viridans]